MELGFGRRAWRQPELCRGSGVQLSDVRRLERANRQPETRGGSGGVSKSARARLDLAAGKGELAIGSSAGVDAVAAITPDAQQPTPPEWLQQPGCGWAHCPLPRSETRC